MWNDLAKEMVLLLRQIVSLDTSLITLVILIILAIIVIDLLLQRVQEFSRSTGIVFTRSKIPIGIEGVKQVPVKDFVSQRLKLAGRPDALLHEDGYIIPVEHKPLAKKLRDRYIAQLVVYMRLIEDIEGKRPPYGYLILGPNSRRVKIVNTRQRQDWLDTKLDEMRGILTGLPAKADPYPSKCLSCRMRNKCDFKVDSNV
jgi:CRISPR/Cas system-associated exonuclease Cas4 (RecB family)